MPRPRPTPGEQQPAHHRRAETRDGRLPRRLPARRDVRRDIRGSRLERRAGCDHGAVDWRSLGTASEGTAAAGSRKWRPPPRPPAAGETSGAASAGTATGARAASSRSQRRKQRESLPAPPLKGLRGARSSKSLRPRSQWRGEVSGAASEGTAASGGQEMTAAARDRLRSTGHAIRGSRCRQRAGGGRGATRYCRRDIRRGPRGRHRCRRAGSGGRRNPPATARGRRRCFRGGDRDLGEQEANRNAGTPASGRSLRRCTRRSSTAGTEQQAASVTRRGRAKKSGRDVCRAHPAAGDRKPPAARRLPAGEAGVCATGRARAGCRGGAERRCRSRRSGSRSVRSRQVVPTRRGASAEASGRRRSTLQAALRRSERRRARWRPVGRRRGRGRRDRRRASQDQGGRGRGRERSTSPARRRRACVVRVYANEELVGEARASQEGTWLLEAKRDVPVGEVVFRVAAVPEEGAGASPSSRRRLRSCATRTASCLSRW